MKVRSNPKHSPAPVEHPFLRGVYVGATFAPTKEKRFFGGKEVEIDGPWEAKFSDEPVELLAEGQSFLEYQKQQPHQFAYFVKKVQEDELLAADEEMAMACGAKVLDAFQKAEKARAAAIDGDGGGTYEDAHIDLTQSEPPSVNLHEGATAHVSGVGDI